MDEATSRPSRSVDFGEEYETNGPEDTYRLGPRDRND